MSRQWSFLPVPEPKKALPSPAFHVGFVSSFEQKETRVTGSVPASKADAQARVFGVSFAGASGFNLEHLEHLEKSKTRKLPLNSLTARL